MGRIVVFEPETVNARRSLKQDYFVSGTHIRLCYYRRKFTLRSSFMKRSFALRLPIVLLLVLSVSAGLPLAPSASSHSTSQTPAAAQTKTLQLTGLTDRVIVRRDERGIAYIEAKNDEDLYFAQGFVTASDRLWQMDLGRRTARGELAEVLGNQALEEDKRHRRFGFAQVAAAEVAQTTPYDRKVLEAYAKGVNAYIGTLDPKNLPRSFRFFSTSQNRGPQPIRSRSPSFSSRRFLPAGVST